MGRKPMDLTGQRSHYLTALSVHGLNNQGRRMWLVRCDCGTTITMETRDFRKGAWKSCGCQRNRLIGEANTTHGMTRHPAFAVWRSMRDRCRLPTHQAWHNYGARGITVDPAWDTFEQFWSDMEPGYAPGLEIERIDNNGNYTPSNCRWATRQEQTSNRRNTRLVDTPWGRMTVAEASRRSGIGVTTLLYRLDQGASGSTIFSTPDVTTALSSRGKPDR